jgi:lantibiotic modifying enzyme
MNKSILNFINKTAEQSITRNDNGPDFYSGLAGQAWFLFHAGLCLNNKKWIKAAELKINKALLEMELIPSEKKAGFYEGSSGIIATAIILADKMKSKKLLNRSLNLWDQEFIKIFTSTDSEDIFTGWAGSILSFAMVWHLIPTKVRKSQAKIIKSWLDAEIPKRGFLTQELGLAHGYAGIAMALRCFSYLEQWKPGLRIANFLEKYIDQNFNSNLRGWESSQINNHSIESWCNGSAGIIIARRSSGGKFNSSTIPEAIKHKLFERVHDKKIDEIPFCHGHTGFLVALELLSKKKNIGPEIIPVKSYRQGLINGHDGVAYYYLNTIMQMPLVLAGIKGKES